MWRGVDNMSTVIEMVRGDSQSFSVWIEDSNGIVPLVTGDTVYFTVKKSAELLEKEFQAIVTSFNNGKGEIKINPSDTKNMMTGRYVYDVQVTFKNGDVKTIIPESAFVIKREVTHE